MIDLRLGRWQDRLADVVVDAVITDPPFGKRTHDGAKSTALGAATDILDFDHWTPAHVDEFVDSWHPRCRGWIVAMTSHDLVPAWDAAFTRSGRQIFAPLPIVLRGMTVRMHGDGPSNWTVWLVVARPKGAPPDLEGWPPKWSKWGTLPGAYVGSAGSDRRGGRGKPAWLLEEIVGHYSRPGHLICDPMAGWGGTLRAAIKLGRRAIGAEVDAWTRDEAFERTQPEPPF